MRPGRPVVIVAVVAGAIAGTALGYVLQRSQLCFHSMFASAWRGRGLLLRGWLLGVALAAVGLSLLFASPWVDGLSRGLPFTPVSNIVGGLLIGLGMVIARSCVSGLFYKLGSGMAGAGLGLAGWVGGELVARRVHLPGPTVLEPGRGATIPGVLGLPALAMAIGFLLLVVAALALRRGGERRADSWQWNWPITGAALGAVTTAGWALAAWGGSSFGPSTVGASASIAAGSPNWWLIAFLLGLVGGAFVAARASGALRLRGESRVRYAQLGAGGFVLGFGGWLAGGCNLGHGLSGAAQLNVSSWVVIAAMAAGVGIGQATGRAAARLRLSESARR